MAKKKWDGTRVPKAKLLNPPLFQKLQKSRLEKLLADKSNPWVEVEEIGKLLNSVSSRKPLRHEQHDAEVFGMFAHYGWAIFSLAQGLLSVAYAWAWYGVGRLFDSPAAQTIFWLAISSSVFGLGGALWHLAAGRQHQKASRVAK